ncbi:MAG TPA: nuclear transport factor 2 family protein [Iamia sp.]|nr:nuclear transport factor 2 family protein [Iamia sp.]
MDPADAADHVALGALQAAYGDAVTRRDWPAVVALFEPDATVTLDLGRGEPRVLGPVELVAFVEEAISRFDLFLFTILNRVVLDVTGDEATGRVWLAEVRQDHDGVATTAYGRYDDTYRRTGATWRIAGRRYRSVARTAPPGSGATFEVVARDDAG